MFIFWFPKENQQEIGKGGGQVDHYSDLKRPPNSIQVDKQSCESTEKCSRYEVVT